MTLRWVSCFVLLSVLASCRAEMLRSAETPIEEVVAYYGEVWRFNADADGLGENESSFLDNRMDLRVLRPDGSEKIVPGYLAQSENGLGFKYHANLSFDEVGKFYVEIRRCAGPLISIQTEICGEEYIVKTAIFNVEDRDRSALPIISPIQQKNHRYMTVGDQLFLKTGAGSPENILAYADFDGTYDAGGAEFPALGEDQLHAFEPHLRDARPDDPVWHGGKGKALLGLFNYYEEVGVNSQYLVGMNVHGDGWDVFPWVSDDNPYVFDVSKLAQWQTVFEHANRRGVAIHFLFTETENESFFEVHDRLETGVAFAPLRKLYYREMVARFGYLPLIIWNLGEENGVVGNTGSDPYRQPTSPAQRLDFTNYIAALDARDHPIVSHNWPDSEMDTYGDLLGEESFSGISLQAHHSYFDKVVDWTQKSKAAGRPWIVTVDEPLGWEFGARPDEDVLPVTGQRDEILSVLWPSLIGGASGVEWYFGWQNNAPTSDLSNEDQRSRHQLWVASAKVRRFFETLPLIEMTPRRDGETMILEGAGHKLILVRDALTYEAPSETPRSLDPFNPQ